MRSRQVELKGQFHHHAELENVRQVILALNANNSRLTRNRHALNTAPEICGLSQRTDQLSSTGMNLISAITLLLRR